MKYKIGDTFLLRTGSGDHISATISKDLGGGYFELEANTPFPMTLSESSIDKCCIQMPQTIAH